MPLLRSTLRILALVLIFLPGVVIQRTILMFTRRSGAFVFPRMWHRAVAAILGIDIIVEGEPVQDRQVIYVANHLSYLDITVLTTIIPSSFVARGDLSGWPIAGLLARLQQTVFISRNRHDILDAKDGIAGAIASGRRLIIFAEGTSSDGSVVLPFKSSLFSVAIDNPANRKLPIQPVTLSLLEVNGRPAIDSAVRNLYAWHSDMTLPPHILQFTRLRGAKIKVKFHVPRDSALYEDRKALCADCYGDVTRGLEPLARAA